MRACKNCTHTHFIGINLFNWNQIYKSTAQLQQNQILFFFSNSFFFFFFCRNAKRRKRQQWFRFCFHWKTSSKRCGGCPPLAWPLTYSRRGEFTLISCYCCYVIHKNEEGVINIHLKKMSRASERIFPRKKMLLLLLLLYNRYSARALAAALDGPFSFGSAVGAHHHRASLQLKGLIE